MTEKKIREQINKILAEGFELTPEQLVPSARLKDDLMLDSLDAVDMLVHLEDNFNVKVEGEKLAQIKTLQDVYMMVTDVLMVGDKQSDRGKDL